MKLFDYLSSIFKGKSFEIRDLMLANKMIVPASSPKRVFDIHL